jgi:hypothetical protein
MSPRVKKYSHRQCIEKLGNMCAICKCRDLEVLQIDHPLHDGYKERRMKGQQQRIYRRIMEGHHKEYRCLCPTCNWRERIRHNAGGRPAKEVTEQDYQDFLDTLKRHLTWLLSGEN